MENILSVDEAIEIVRSNQFSKENFQRIVNFAKSGQDPFAGNIVEAFIAAAPNLDFLDSEDTFWGDRADNLGKPAPLGFTPRQGLTKEIITNKQNEQQTVYKRVGEPSAAKQKPGAIQPKGQTAPAKASPPEPSKLEQFAHSTTGLVHKAWESEELPSRVELAKYAGEGMATFFENPVAAVKQGLAREAAAREAYEAVTGQKVPSKMKLIGMGMKKLGLKAKVKKLVMNDDALLAGIATASSIAGNAVGGPVVGLAADLTSTLVARKALEFSKASKAADAELQKDEAFAAASSLGKLKIKSAATLAQMKSAEAQKELEKNLVGDAGGWAVGNAIAAAIPIPLSGAAVAMATMPTVISPIATRAHDKVRGGVTPAKAAQEAIDEILLSGDRTEREMRAEFTKTVRKIKKGLPSGQ